MSDTNVRGALIQAASDFLTTGTPAIDAGAIAWENRVSDAVSNADLWSSVFYRPNTPEARTVGFNGIDEQTGFLQIDINSPVGEGESQVNAWEDKARSFFAGGNKFTLGNISVLVTSTGMSQGRSVDNHYRKSLTIAFRAQLKRQN